MALSVGDEPPLTVKPVHRTDAYAVRRHQEILSQIRSERDDVVFFGDSHVDLWDQTGWDSWSQKILPFRAANFGVSSDRTETLLWRLKNGELEGQPRVAVVEIGTNDLVPGRDPAARVDHAVAGIAAVVSTIRTLSPKTRVLLMGVFPRGVEPDDPFRTAVRQVNERIAGLADDVNVKFLDISSVFLRPDGTRPETSYGIHPSPQQFDAWANAIRETLARWLNLVTAPTVRSVEVVYLLQSINKIVLKFNEALDASSARNPGNYSISQTVPGNSLGERGSSQPEAIQSVIYDPKTWTATLIPARSLRTTQRYELTVRGTRPNGVRDRFGTFLDGRGDGRAGTSYVTTIEGPRLG